MDAAKPCYEMNIHFRNVKFALYGKYISLIEYEIISTVME